MERQNTIRLSRVLLGASLIMLFYLIGFNFCTLKARASESNVQITTDTQGNSTITLEEPVSLSAQWILNPTINTPGTAPGGITGTEESWPKSGQITRIDLNGNTLTIPNTIGADPKYGILIQNGTVEITDSKGNGQIIVKGQDGSNSSPNQPQAGVGGICCQGSTTLTITNADINLELASEKAAGFFNFTVFVTENANVTVNGDSTISGNPGIAVIASKSDASASASLTVSGNATVTTHAYSGYSPIMTSPGDLGTPVITIEENATVTATSPSNTTHSGETAGVVASAPNGVVNINGGTIEGYSGLYVTAGQINVTDGKIIGNGSTYSENGVSGEENQYGPNGSAITVLPTEPTQENDRVDLNITGGTFESQNAYAVDIPTAANNLIDSGSLEISGGNFSGKEEELNLVPKNAQNSVTGGVFSHPVEENYLSPEVCVSVNPSDSTETAYFTSVKKAEQYIQSEKLTNADLKLLNTTPDPQQAQILSLQLSSDGFLQYYNTNANATQKGVFNLNFTSIGTQSSQLTPQQVNWKITSVQSGSIITFPENQNAVWTQVGGQKVYGNSVSTTWQLPASPPYSDQVYLQYTQTMTEVNGIPSYAFSDLALVYNGGNGSARLLNDVYALSATAQDGWYNPKFTSTVPESSLRFIVQDSPVARAVITLNEKEVLSPYTLDLSTGRSADFNVVAYNTKDESVDAATIVWSLGNVVGIAEQASASEYAQLNTQTGNLTFIKSLPTGAYLELNCVVNGLNATPNPLLITTSGILAPEEMSGIEPVYDPMYTTGILYNLAENVVTTPNNVQADPALLSFTTDTTGVTIYNGQLVPNNSRFAGPVSIQATFSQGDSVYTTNFTVHFTKTQVPAEGLSAQEELVFTLPNWNTQNVKAQLIPVDTTEQPTGGRSAYQYASSDENIALVDAFGNVTPIAPGEAEITSSYNGWQSTTFVRVTEAGASIKIDPANVYLDDVGDSATLTCLLEQVDTSETITWVSEDLSVATVTPGDYNTATVTATGYGTTQISASIGEYRASATVTVGAAEYSIELDPTVVFLAPKEAPNAQLTSVNVTALAPNTANLTWSITDESVASVTGNGASATVEANNEGRTLLNVTDGTVTAEIPVVVSANPVVARDVLVAAGSTPDEFTLIAEDVQKNPALKTGEGTIEKVSMFAWSSSDQSDIHAIKATNIGNISGTDAAEYEAHFSVNQNGANNYFLDADKIFINVYALPVGNTTGEGFLVYANNIQPYKSVNDATVTDPNANIAYIGYLQNIGFQQPTVYNGSQAGTTGEARPMEGVRISSNTSGVSVQTRAHIQNIGWIDTVSDGVYAGTIDKALALEAVELTLTGENAQNYTLEYRAHVANIGWQDWVRSGQLAGTTGRNLGIEALEIRLVPKK